MDRILNIGYPVGRPRLVQTKPAKPPRLRQYQIAVAKGRVSDSGKVEDRFGIGQTSAPKIEEPPNRNLRQMEQDQPPDHAEQHPDGGPMVPFGNRAKHFVSDLAFEKEVKVEVKGQDRYWGTVANVILPDGKNLNREIVNVGYAWWFSKYAPRDTELQALESEARRAKRGLWVDRDPVPPWEYRTMIR